MTSVPSPEAVRAAAEVAGVCARPVISRVTDLDSDDVRLVPISCGSTREDRCRPCAERARRLRMQQCREGWHLDTEPEWATDDQDQDDEAGAEDADCSRRRRSTGRRQAGAALPPG